MPAACRRCNQEEHQTWPNPPPPRAPGVSNRPLLAGIRRLRCSTLQTCKGRGRVSQHVQQDGQYTLWKTNMEPENRPSIDYTLLLQGPPLRFHVSFLEGILNCRQGSGRSRGRTSRALALSSSSQNGVTAELAAALRVRRSLYAVLVAKLCQRLWASLQKTCPRT